VRFQQQQLLFGNFKCRHAMPQRSIAASHDLKQPDKPILKCEAFPENLGKLANRPLKPQQLTQTYFIS
jgi:hypothetical protein